MAERYVKISREEMDEFMSSNFFTCINPDQRSQELVYFITWGDDNYALKVYSSILTISGGREIGADAIRVVMFINTNAGLKAMWKAPRVYRTQNWRKNLQQRINEGLLRGCEGRDYKCPRCGSPKILRDGKNGLFWSCSMWPITKCPFTENFVAGDDE